MDNFLVILRVSITQCIFESGVRIVLYERTHVPWLPLVTWLLSEVRVGVLEEWVELLDVTHACVFRIKLFLVDLRLTFRMSHSVLLLLHHLSNLNILLLGTASVIIMTSSLPRQNRWYIACQLSQSKACLRGALRMLLSLTGSKDRFLGSPARLIFSIYESLGNWQAHVRHWRSLGLVDGLQSWGARGRVTASWGLVRL